MRIDWRGFEPCYLPPYSPDFNPIERIWLTIKSRWFNSVHCKDREILIAKLDRALLDVIHNPQCNQHTASIR